MPQCPFCKGKVEEDLLRFGGHCPHCLNEIPGEEAATDPGAQARARQELEARVAAARVQRRNRLLTVLAALLLIVGVGAYAVFHEEPAPLMLDDVEIYIPPASAHRNVAAEEAAAAQAKAEEEEKHKKEAASHHVATTAGTTQVTTDMLATAGPAPSSPTTAPPETTADSLNQSSLGGFDLSPKGPALKGIGPITATSDTEIKQMAKTVVDANFRQLRQCYESRIKENPSLSGRWVVAWTIESDGSVSKAEAEGQGVNDRAFESCMVRSVETWKFQPVSKRTELARAFVFSN